MKISIDFSLQDPLTIPMGSGWGVPVPFLPSGANIIFKIGCSSSMSCGESRPQPSLLNRPLGSSGQILGVSCGDLEHSLETHPS